MSARTSALALLAFGVFAGGDAWGQRAAHAPALPSLPTLPRIRLEAAKDHLTVIEDVRLSRGDWQGGDLDLFVAFGAPGIPDALDARLFAVDDSAAFADETGEPIVVERASKRPSSARLLLGRPQMAGVVLHVREAAFRRAVSPADVARIRLRSLINLPPEDARTGREVVVRLGVEDGPPLALGEIQIASLVPRWVTRVEAHLCGPDADPYPLAISISPLPPSGAPPQSPPPGAPVLAVRHATDDLCVRFWTS